MGLRHAAALILIVLVVPAVLPAAPLSKRTAVERLRAYASAWQTALAAVVAEERYTQKVSKYPLGRRFRHGNSTVTARVLVSDILLVQAREDAWLMFRDVLSVNGDRVRDRQQRFDDLFARPDVNLVTTARTIADEGARYNLGALFRNINTPVAALVFLEERYTSSVRWRDPKAEELDGRPVVRLDFEQKQAPYAVRALDHEPIQSQGTFWIESDSGRIVRSELEMRGSVMRQATDGGSARVRVGMRLAAGFGAVPGVEPWVPLRMNDRYSLDGGSSEEELSAEAVYSNHRIFQTAGRIISGTQ